MKMEVEKRFALLLAAPDSDYVTKMYGGYFDVFVEAFGEEGETWDLFRVVEGEFPDSEELAKYDGYVVSGSPADAYGDDLWILGLCFLLQTLDAMKKKILGVCFGHQVWPPEFPLLVYVNVVSTACTGWDVGIRKLRMAESLPPHKYLDELRELPPSPHIIECHQDEVVIPRTFPSYLMDLAGSGATSWRRCDRLLGEDCRGDVLPRDHILGIQGHPEYTKGILYNLADRLSSFAEEAKASVEATEPDRKFWETVCRAFLKGR
ncbi:unnamed protein product [Spirodela intermedia]|uniref:Glutamine amidotransferase domain-containing protein n=1 Tax=Spirodela intermedia TaxID=51605 RepID=A0A7I8JLH5_SPIIN|nr:unnamed protein product [Spirodela intermedia]CAA6671026.1 unnamed protein product [Spirodela intermedia]